jgi:hypothetical protein
MPPPLPLGGVFAVLVTLRSSLPWTTASPARASPADTIENSSVIMKRQLLVRIYLIHWLTLALLPKSLGL